MRTRAVLLTVTMLFASTFLQQSASAKGAWSVTLSGPGLDSPVVLGTKAGRDVARTANLSGMYAVLFETEPNLVLDGKPDQDLGPRFVISYHFDGPNIAGNVVRQDVYPYAQPNPITYVEPGQQVYDQAVSFGGWYEASPRLLRFLRSEGLPDPKTATSETLDTSKADGNAAAEDNPAVAQDSPSGSVPSTADNFPVLVVVAGLVGAVLLIGLWIVMRRRRLGPIRA